MNPCGILTGLRGQRGKVVWRMVYKGALYVEGSAMVALSQRGFW